MTGFAFEPETDHRLSALYGAIGHANNMPLARWLLEHGANPDDNDSLYHSTELGHTDGLRTLLEHGAIPKGTNALPRAIDFNSTDAFGCCWNKVLIPMKASILTRRMNLP